jgi:hemerythrin-like metal-binding protein
LNELNDAMEQGRGRFVVQGVLQQLLEYTRQHFAAEEDAMRAVAFDGLESHIAEHRKLTAKVEMYAAEYSRGDTGISMDVLFFLRDWLQDHILCTDHKYKEALKRAEIE